MKHRREELRSGNQNSKTGGRAKAGHLRKQRFPRVQDMWGSEETWTSKIRRPIMWASSVSTPDKSRKLRPVFQSICEKTGLLTSALSRVWGDALPGLLSISKHSTVFLVWFSLLLFLEMF